MTYSDSINFLVAMIIMMNPLGSLSIFLALTKHSEYYTQRQIAVRTTLAMILIMLITVWSGKELLALLGITIPSFRFAGGIILLLIGLEMLQSRESPFHHTREDDKAAEKRHSIAIVPLALPIIIGPGSISTLIIVAGDYYTLKNKLWVSSLCLLLALGVGLLLFYARTVAKIVGPSIIKVITRIMGMIIMAIAVGMLADGLTGLFPVLQI